MGVVIGGALPLCTLSVSNFQSQGGYYPNYCFISITHNATATLYSNNDNKSAELEWVLRQILLANLKVNTFGSLGLFFSLTSLMRHGHNAHIGRH